MRQNLVMSFKSHASDVENGRSRCSQCVCAIALLLSCDVAIAGMPAPIPLFEDSGTTESDEPGAANATWAVERHLQAISFFVACMLGLAWVVKVLWNALRRDILLMPPLGYGRAVSLVLLWGLLFVVILTMISGARELMTPGAWRKQGWTYALRETQQAPATASGEGLEERRAGIERLRGELLLWAASHGGQFPPAEFGALPAEVATEFWELPGWPGLKYLYVPGQRIEQAATLLAFEPRVTEGDRLVLLTNGAIATMSTVDIQRALADTQSSEVAGRD